MKDYQKLTVDMAFYTLGYYFFFNDFIGIPIVAGAIMALFRWSPLYDKAMYSTHFFEFTDWLNQLHANLSVGLNFNNALLKLESENFPKRLAPYIQRMKKEVHFSGDDAPVYAVIKEAFPIEEARILVEMLGQSKRTGASVSIVVGIILNQLHAKNKIRREIKSILFQKKLEQSILCLAPIGIIAFINMSSESYLVPLYTTLTGRGIMLVAFAIVVAMKWIGQKIVSISVDI
ncbi:type II secretion system F family protein [Fusibacter sp. JL298sf-3]